MFLLTQRPSLTIVLNKRPQRYLSSHVEPFIGITLFALLIYLQVQMVLLSIQLALVRAELIATVIIGHICGWLAYISVLLTYNKFRRIFTRDPRCSPLSLIFGCRTASYIKFSQEKYKYKYIMIIVGISTAIAMSAIVKRTRHLIKLESTTETATTIDELKDLIVQHTILFWEL